MKILNKMLLLNKNITLYCPHTGHFSQRDLELITHQPNPAPCHGRDFQNPHPVFPGEHVVNDKKLIVKNFNIFNSTHL